MLRPTSIASLVVAGICCVLLAMHIHSHPQRMSIMNVVWPVTPLYMGPFALLAYFWFGRRKEGEETSGRKHEDHPQPARPLWQEMFIGTAHCGAACTLGDISTLNSGF